MKARTQRLPPLIVGDLIVTDRVRIGCGCALYLGDDDIVAVPCMKPHQRLVDRAVAIVEGSDGSATMVQACSLALEQAQREIRPWLAQEDDGD